MDNIKDLLSHIAAIVIILLGIVYVGYIFASGNKFDEAVIDKIMNRSSVYQSYAYLDEERIYTNAEVIADIINSEKNQIIELDGIELDMLRLNKAREDNSYAIQYLKNMFTRDAYRKKYIYAQDGTMIGLSYFH